MLNILAYLQYVYLADHISHRFGVISSDPKVHFDGPLLIPERGLCFEKALEFSPKDLLFHT